MADPLGFLFALERLGMKFGLESITRLCEALGHPEQAFQSIIIAGTNGKGSVTALVDAMLREAGYRTARYTSPHLVRLEERYAIGGADVESGPLRWAASRVQTAVESLQASGRLASPPTFFECATAIAFDLFRQAEVEIAVLEVGLGGRLDATNVVTPIAAAITSIDFDHQAQLGESIESIAREKAGVIKPGIPVVCGPLPAAAGRVIEAVCDQAGARLIHAPERVRITARPGTPLLDIRTDTRLLDGATLGLPGRHQLDNAAVAIALIDAVSGRWPVADQHVRSGLAHASWPARLEMFSAGHSRVLLDAAHNPAGARALASYLSDINWTGVTLVFGAMRDKDIRGMIDALGPFCRAIVCTTAPNPRAMPARELAALVAAAPAIRVEAVDDPAAALSRARALDDRVVAAGSIFLIGPLRDILR